MRASKHRKTRHTAGLSLLELFRNCYRPILFVIPQRSGGICFCSLRDGLHHYRKCSNNRQPATYVVMSTPRQNATWCFTLRAAGFGSG
jgi:hypothetical protein